jgi:hypothetical protein
VKPKEFKLTIPKNDFLKIVSFMDEITELADKHGVKFGAYSEEQLLEILYLYRNFKTGDNPPF